MNSKPAAGGRKAAAKRLYSIVDIEPEDLKPAIEEVQTAIENDRRGTLERCYGIGLAIDRHYRRLVKEHDENGWEERGNRYFEQLAEALGAEAGWLRSHHRLVRVFDVDEFGELCHTPGMTATQALRLAGVKDELRSELVKRVADERLTVRELDAAIKQAIGPRRQPGAGRPLKRPKKVQEGLIHMATQAEQFVRLSNSVWRGHQYDIVTEIKELPMDQVNEKLKAQIEDAAAKCEDLAGTAMINANALRDSLPEIERRMAAQAELEAGMQAELDAEEQQAGAAA